VFGLRYPGDPPVVLQRVEGSGDVGALGEAGSREGDVQIPHGRLGDLPGVQVREHGSCGVEGVVGAHEVEHGLGCVKDLGQVLGVDHAAAVAAVR
jgi:hypothetical protein